MIQSSVTVYGANWCGYTNRTLVKLDDLSIPYCYLNIDSNPMADEEVRELNRGDNKLPAVVIEGHGTRILLGPDEAELVEALDDMGVLGRNNFVQ